MNNYMNIKNFAAIATIAAALFATGCAKTAESGKYDDDQAQLAAWLEKYHSDAQKAGRGIYILSDDSSEVTEGDAIEKDGYAYIEYSVTDLDGNLTQYTDAENAKLMGTYVSTNYYGPKVICTVAKSSYAGLIDALDGMQPGQKRTVLIPNWLLSYKEHSDEAGYLKESTSLSHSIFTIKAVKFVKDVTEYQNEMVGNYVSKCITDRGLDKEAVDTIAEGLYLITLREAVDTNAFPTDSTYYINYTGMLLDGTVFDTTDEKLAKISGLYNSSRTYGATSVKNAESASGITLGGSSVISGFYNSLYKMRSMQKALAVFNSDYGYQYSGSGNSIPGYAPLVFEIDMAEKPE